MIVMIIIIINHLKPSDAVVYMGRIAPLYTGGAKKCIHILRDIIYVLLFEVELNYCSNV